VNEKGKKKKKKKRLGASHREDRTVAVATRRPRRKERKERPLPVNGEVPRMRVARPRPPVREREGREEREKDS